ncbi:MAG: winged helix-turn-helix transcriptional regulator [Solirubrobacterales bacterium]
MPGATDPVAERLRVGGRALLLLADSVSVSILRLLAEAPLESTELINRLENVSRSTCFDRLRDLEELSLILREKRPSVPPSAECRLSDSGRGLLHVADLLEAWLARAPDGPLELGDPSAAAAIKALALGWGSTMLRWLAEQPRSLSELEQLVDDLGYRKLERAAHSLVETGLAERVAVNGRLNPYTVTAWAREAVTPLAAAVRWERRELPERSAPVTATDAEGGLLLARPIVDLPPDLAAMAEDGSASLYAGSDSAFAESLIAALHEQLRS